MKWNVFFISMQVDMYSDSGTHVFIDYKER